MALDDQQRNKFLGEDLRRLAISLLVVAFVLLFAFFLEQRFSIFSSLFPFDDQEVTQPTPLPTSPAE